MLPASMYMFGLLASSSAWPRPIFSISGRRTASEAPSASSLASCLAQPSSWRSRAESVPGSIAFHALLISVIPTSLAATSRRSMSTKSPASFASCQRRAKTSCSWWRADSTRIWLCIAGESSFAMSCRCMRDGLTAASASRRNSSRSRVTLVRRAMNSLMRSTFCAASRPKVEMSTSLVPCSVPVRTALESPLLAVLM